MSTIASIEGIGEKYAIKLRTAGIRTTEALLKVGSSRKGRIELAAKTGFSPQTILEWVNRADMFRVPGIGSQYSDLLESSGVDTVRELAGRNADVLFATITKANEEKNKVNRLPTLKQVKKWIQLAKSRPKRIEY